MGCKEPGKLNSKTPQWFREWHNREFWHFKTGVENSLSLHGKIIWIVFAAIIGSIIARYVIGH